MTSPVFETAETFRPDSNAAICSRILRPAMPELDSIRGLAILMVVFYHGFYTSTLNLARYPRVVRLFFNSFWLGRLGVSLFFVLSGFLISGILLDSKTRSDYYSRFYIRRILRIVPAYFLALVVLAFVFKAPWPFVVLSIVYLSNVAPLFGMSIAYPVLWSLAVEEHFYLFWPLIVRRSSIRQLAIWCLVVIGVSPILRALSFSRSSHDGLAYVCNEFTWNSLDGLACGALLAFWLRSTPSRVFVKRAALLLLAGAILVELLGLPWGIYTRQTIVGAAFQIVPWNFAFSALILIFLLAGTSDWQKIVKWRILRFFGEISYGLYLFHVFIFWTVDYLTKRGVLRFVGTDTPGQLIYRFLVVFTTAVLVSWVSRRTIEEYFLSLKDRFTSR